jgi:hypothetical protein
LHALCLLKAEWRADDRPPRHPIPAAREPHGTMT